MFQIRVWESISKSVEVNLISNVTVPKLISRLYGGSKFNTATGLRVPQDFHNRIGIV